MRAGRILETRRSLDKREDVGFGLTRLEGRSSGICRTWEGEKGWGWSVPSGVRGRGGARWWDRQAKGPCKNSEGANENVANACSSLPRSFLTLQVCGIGNQGALYKNHRHSIGLFLIEALRSHLRYPTWNKDNRSGGYWSNVNGPCALFKTNVWMNQSGRPVSKAYKKVGGEDWGRLCVIYDDLELSVGAVKLRTDGMGKYQPSHCS